MSDFEFIQNLVQKHGIALTAERKMPLFSVSSIAHGYAIHLFENAGISFDSVAAVGGNNFCHFMANEPAMIEKMEKLVGEHQNKLITRFLVPFMHSISKLKAETQLRIEKNGDTWDDLEFLAENYPQYSGILALYNGFWRYFGNNPEKGTLGKDFFERIGKERDETAKWYPIAEQLLQKTVEKLGKEMNIEGDLLRYLMVPEMKEFIVIKKLHPSMQNVLSDRRNHYFYLYIQSENIEKVWSEKSLVEMVEKKFISVSDTTITEVKGHSAYPGIVKGIVFNHSTHEKPPVKPFILVTSMTHPKDIALIKQAEAIVTNEGGVLCHAAIVARELKKPCIIGTKIATQVLKQGMEIEVNAEKGTVKIVK